MEYQTRIREYVDIRNHVGDILSAILNCGKRCCKSNLEGVETIAEPVPNDALDPARTAHMATYLILLVGSLPYAHHVATPIIRR